MTKLDIFDRELLSLDPEREGLADMGDRLDRRGELVAELARLAAEQPSEETRAAVLRALHSGAELTRRLAGYRQALHGSVQRLNQYVVPDGETV